MYLRETIELALVIIAAGGGFAAGFATRGWWNELHAKIDPDLLPKQVPMERPWRRTIEDVTDSPFIPQSARPAPLPQPSRTPNTDRIKKEWLESKPRPPRPQPPPPPKNEPLTNVTSLPSIEWGKK